jgi:hypothetical protein
MMVASRFRHSERSVAKSKNPVFGLENALHDTSLDMT